MGTPKEPATPPAQPVDTTPKAPDVAGEPTEAATPPWGDDFDAEKAWERIQKQSKDIDKLRAAGVLSADQKTKLAEYDQLVEASKTELEKAQEAANKVVPLQAENLRLQVALAKNVPADLVGRLQGDSREALEADADFLMSKLAAPSSTEPRTPKPNPAQGSSAAGAPDHAALVAEAKKAGDWKTVIALENQKLAKQPAG